MNILRIKTDIGQHATTAQILNSMIAFPHGPDDLSHRLFQLRPLNLNELRRVEECQFEAVSDWVYDLIIRVCAEKDKDAAATIYYQLEKTPSAGLFRGRLFEKQVLDFLDRIESNHDLSIRRLSKTGGANSNWTYHGPIRRYTFEEPMYLVPPAPNFAAVDSIFKQRSVATTRLKSQVSGKYKSGSKKAHRLRSCAPLRRLPKVDGDGRWRFIFIVPKKVEPTFTKQELQGDTDKGIWVDQYVLGLDEKTIFESRTAPSRPATVRGMVMNICL